MPEYLWTSPVQRGTRGRHDARDIFFFVTLHMQIFKMTVFNIQILNIYELFHYIIIVINLLVLFVNLEKKNWPS